MPTYLSPGVYVEEKPGGVQPIVGVGTSTAGFIGFFPDRLEIPEQNPNYDPTKAAASAGAAPAPSPAPAPAPEGLKGEVLRVEGDIVTIKDAENKELKSEKPATNVEPGLKVGDKIEYVITDGKLSSVRKPAAPRKPAPAPATPSGPDETLPFRMTQFPPDEEAVVRKARERAESQKLDVEAAERNARAELRAHLAEIPKMGEVKFVSNYGEFKRLFGDFSTNPGHRNLAHAVFGFFANGGTRCWVVRLAPGGNIQDALEKFEGIDEIALVVAPGVTDAGAKDALVTHCKTTGDRFAIIDLPEEVGAGETPDLARLRSGNPDVVPRDTDYAAVYFPHIQVTDPATKIQNPAGNGRIYVPPSGHIAGIYARVDQERGVHKAPANVEVRGALDLRYYISKAHQESLNPVGINCIRDLNGALRVWGARTVGGDRNGEWKYINIRRTFLYLRESIDEGTQWCVFEPNDRMLWGKIVRNVSAFLTNVWRDGALFGSTPSEAFYVKCDDETNPPSIRDVGQVVTEIGVALTKPAEFVIFRISQWAGPEKTA